jgi:subtilisin family serine protease
METTWVTGRAAAGAARLAGVLVSLLCVVLVVGVHAYLPGGPRQSKGGQSATVTLITGDRVHLQWRSGGEVQATIVPAPGREAISFARMSSTNLTGQRPVSEDLSIVPADAQPLLANGLLDPALFNVTGLVRQGLTTPDDGAAGATGAAGGLPLIVTFEPARARVAPLLLTGATGVQQGHELPSIGGVAVADGKGAAGAFWKWLTGGGGTEQTAALAAGTASSPGLAAGVVKVWLDARAQPLLNESGPQIGVPQARALGLTGAGVAVAVLDSGIKADHPDLAGRIAESRDFTGTLPDASDDVGHGTHVAGIIGGTGAASAGQYQGVAPGVTLINGKVCVVQGCPSSAIIAGMEWAAPRARVINMSIGGPPTDGADPMSQALDTLTALHGTLFIVSAGNFGRPMSVSSPASAREAVAVGSVTKQDTLSPFSSQGPRVGNFAIKPDLAAPGSSIVSARVPGTEVGEVDPVDANYVRVSGTSMAAPHVVGAAALLLQQHPEWTNAQLRAALTSSAAPIQGLSVFQQGAGRLDVGRAVTQSVFARGTASFGLIPWPHDRPATTQTVTYANYGSEPVTLDLALLATDAQGSPAPDGMFAVNVATVTVPAQGTADAQVTLTPANRTIGTFSGRLIATRGTARVVTAVGAVQEPESYNLTLRGIGMAPSFSAFGWVFNLETGGPQSFSVGTGRPTITLRLPKGRYEVDAGIASSSSGSSGPSMTLASEPDVTLDADKSVLLDATRGRRVSVNVGRSDTAIDGQGLIITSGLGNGGFATVSFTFTSVAAPYAIPNQPVTGRFYEFVYEPVLGVPVQGVTPRRFSPIYTLVLSTKGRIPEQLALVVGDRDLARVRTTYHAQGVLATGRRSDAAFTPQRRTAGRVSSLGAEPLPSQRVEYFTPGRDLEWGHFMDIADPGSSFFFLESESVWDRTYRPGHHEAAWNRAPLGPAFSTAGPLNAREDNTIVVSAPPFSGNQEGHYTRTLMGEGVSGTTRLTRDGETLGENANLCGGRFVVPDSPGRYTLTCTASRSLPISTLGTRSEGAWTFAAPGRAPTPTPIPVPLPLLAVRATGAVFGMNDAPAGRLFPLVLHVDRPVGAPSVRIASLELDVSFDDGVTWKRVPVLRVPGDDRGLAILHHPRAAGFVSLRLRAADADGNRVTHTTIRAYGLTVVR